MTLGATLITRSAKLCPPIQSSRLSHARAFGHREAKHWRRRPSVVSEAIRDTSPYGVWRHSYLACNDSPSKLRCSLKNRSSGDRGSHQGTNAKPATIAAAAAEIAKNWRAEGTRQTKAPRGRRAQVAVGHALSQPRMDDHESTSEAAFPWTL